jgi:hypothetical protein
MPERGKTREHKGQSGEAGAGSELAKNGKARPMDAGGRASASGLA